jgi:ribosome-associated toxin RatA of RatAB toxin-antitoxin module
MFELINDVARYPEFVPGCAAAQVLERSAGSLRAQLTVGNGALKTSFITRNTLEPFSAVRMDLEQGPFRSLKGLWTLTPVTSPQTQAVMGCRVELHLQFEAKGGLAGMALNPLIERMAGSLVEAFVTRARQEVPAGAGPQ